MTAHYRPVHDQPNSWDAGWQVTKWIWGFEDELKLCFTPWCEQWKLQSDSGLENILHFSKRNQTLLLFFLIDRVIYWWASEPRSPVLWQVEPRFDMQKLMKVQAYLRKCEMAQKKGDDEKKTIDLITSCGSSVYLARASTWKQTVRHKRKLWLEGWQERGEVY